MNQWLLCTKIQRNQTDMYFTLQNQYLIYFLTSEPESLENFKEGPLNLYKKDPQ